MEKWSVFSVQFQCLARSFPSENDQTIDSLGKVPSFEIEAAYLTHEELCLRIGLSILACPAPIELQTQIFFVLQEASSFEQLFLFGQLGQQRTFSVCEKDVSELSL